MTKAVHTSPEYKEFLALVRDKKIPVTDGLRGTEFDFSSTEKIKILYPGAITDSSNLNNTSEVLMLEDEKNKFLFMGDLEKEASDKLIGLGYSLQAEVIKVPHHGSQNALNEELYKKVKPEYAIISVGAGNSYGHPHQILLNFLQKAGIKTDRTDQEGDIGFSSDGTRIERIKSGIKFF